MIDLRQLECFCAVVQSGSFSKAAAALAIGQPGLSRQVRKLEAQIGSRLLYRNGRGVALTPGGRRFHATVSELMVKLREAYDQASDALSEPSGTVALGLPPSMSGLVGAPVLRRLKTRWPGIKLLLIDGFSGHVHEWLLSGRVDLAILHDARHTPAISAEHLLSEDLFLVGREAPPFATIEDGEPAIALADVAGLPLVVPGPEHGLRRQLDKVCADANISLNIENDMDSLMAIKHLVHEGDVYSILPVGCVYAEIADGRLQAWRIAGPRVVNTMVLAAAQNRPFTSAMREVRAMIRAEIATLSATQMGWHKTSGKPAALPLRQTSKVRDPRPMAKAS